jgi:hypothetical protein
MEGNKTTRRDVDYGIIGNLLYSQFKGAANVCFTTGDHSKEMGGNCLTNLVDGIENPKILFSIPYNVDKNSVGYKAAREGVEDAYLERGLPSPFPNRAPVKPISPQTP